MQLILLISVAATLASAAPAPAKPTDKVVLPQHNNTNDGLGNYRFAYALPDKTQHSESGTLKNPGEESQYLEVKGRYSWVGPDGILYKVTYTADENGFHPHVSTSIATVGYQGQLSPALIASLVGK